MILKHLDLELKQAFKKNLSYYYLMYKVLLKKLN